MNKKKNSSLRILYVSEVAPNQSSFGGAMRSLNVLRALKDVGSVEVVVIDDKTGAHDQTQNPDGEFTVAKTFEVIEQPPSRLIDQLRWTFDPRGSFPNGCGVNQDATDYILRRLPEFDLIWFFKLRSPDMFPNASWPRSVVDVDDLPSSYEQAALRAGGSPSERLKARRRQFSWRRREKLMGSRFTVLSVCSPEDKNYLTQIGVNAPVHVVPNGFEMPKEQPIRVAANPPRIGFIGLFEHFPNRDAMEWFTSKCWPQIKRDVPDARLRLIGQGSEEFSRKLGPDVDGLGWLADPSGEISTWSVMAVPIRVGAGTRVKIAFGFSQKCPIVSTSFGAWGYGAVDGGEMYLADSPELFSAACVKLIREPAIAEQMAERAWQKFLNNWTWDSIRPAVWATAEDCLRRA
jgi:glycosyltransferase involved in cell wall biosynthesis